MFLFNYSGISTQETYIKNLKFYTIEDGVTGLGDGELCDHGTSNVNKDFATGYMVDCIATGSTTPDEIACKWAHYCGDGKVDGPGGDGFLTGPEACDDGPLGNIGEYDKCAAGCLEIGPHCGDGIVNGTEQCDAGMLNSNDPGDPGVTCRTNCKWAKCGDNIQDTGEECDNGTANSNTTPNACRTNCTVSKCGDGITDSGEDCDDGDLGVSGVRAKYTFDETSLATAEDTSGNVFNGSIVGAHRYNIGRFGKAMEFDGINDYVILPASNTLAPGPQATISVWVKSKTGYNSGARILTLHRLSSATTGFGLMIDANKFSVYASNGTTSGYLSSGVAVDTDWHHILATNDGSTLRIYVDGIERASRAGGFVTGTKSGYIGHFDGSSTIYAWKGLIDHAEVYNRAITPEEVSALYNLYNDSCNNCKNAKCGDGFWKTRNSTTGQFDAGISNEQCDDGNNSDNDYCASDCMTITGSCGNAVIESGSPASEQCDRSTIAPGIGAYCTGPCTGSGASMVCKEGCTVNHGACSDGNIDYIAGEACDDGNTINGDYCSHPGCQVTGSCGDAIIQVNETCDSSTTAPGVGAYCVADCQTLLGNCGDGKIQGPGYTTSYYGGTLPTTPATWTLQGPEYCDINDPRTASLTNTTGCNATTCTRDGSCGDGIRQSRFEACDVLLDKETLFFKFNESSGTVAADSSGNGFNGTVTSAVWTNPGRFGNALSFDGASDYVSVANKPALQITGSQTVMAWVKLNADLTTNAYVFRKAMSGEGGMLINASEIPYYYYGKGTDGVTGDNSGTNRQTFAMSSTAALTVGEWAHIAIVRDLDSATKKLYWYKNGVLINSTAATYPTASPSTNALTVSINSTTQAFNGLIDEFRVYSKPLSASEINFVMNNSKPLCRTGCMNDAIGKTDQINNNLIYGWACDPDQPMRQAEVRLEFYDKNNNYISARQFSTSLVSDQTIKNACGGGANHRWSFDPNDATLNLDYYATNQPFRVDIYALSKDTGETDSLIGTGQFSMKQICGDGVIQREDCTGYTNCEEVDPADIGSIETCDDGNMVNTDNCKNNCSLPACGDTVVSIHATGTYKEICETGTTTSCVSAGVTGGTGTVTCKTDCSAWNTVPTGCSTATAASKALCVCQKAWTCPTKPYWNNEFDTSYYNVDTYAQYWVGTGTWDPANDTTTQYSETPSSTSCQFTCGYNLTWDGGLGKCVGITNPTPFNCANYFTPGTGKVLNTPSTYTQTWSYSGSGWGWSPADDTTVDYSSTYVGPTNPCTYRCNTGYTYYNGTCYPDSKSYTCAAKPANSIWWNSGGSYTQNYSGSGNYSPAATSPTYNDIPNSTACIYKCNPGYKDNGGVSCYYWSCGDGNLMDRGYVDATYEKVRYYFNEGSGPIAYDSRSSTATGSNGNIVGATWTTAGRFEDALSFSGAMSGDNPVQYVNITSYTPPTNTFTMMAWVKTSVDHQIDAQSTTSVDGTAGQKYLFGADNRTGDGGAGVSVGKNGVSVYEHGSDYMPPLAVYNASIGTGWVHVAVVYNSRTPSIYINGVWKMTGLTSPKTTVYAPTTVGGGTYGAFQGEIDHVRIFSRALTATEIKSAMGEFCDDGSLNGAYGHCNSTCDGPGPYCGDGIFQRASCSGYSYDSCTVASGASEECDYGKNYNSADGTRYLCNNKLGLTRSSYYTPSTRPSCSSTCGILNAVKGTNCNYCGDGIVNGSETCDDGDLNGTDDNYYCDSTCSKAKIIYVDDNKSGTLESDGTKWSNAFGKLQTGLDFAKKALEDGVAERVILRVAGGTYKPSFAAGRYSVRLHNTYASSNRGWVNGYARKLNVSGTTPTLSNLYTTTTSYSDWYNFEVSYGGGESVKFTSGGYEGGYWHESSWFEVRQGFNGSGAVYFATLPGFYYYLNSTSVTTSSSRISRNQGVENFESFQKHFQLINYVYINGGYRASSDGDMTRSKAAYPTYISGDMNSSSSANGGDSYNVFRHNGVWCDFTRGGTISTAKVSSGYLDNRARLDGVYVRYGYGYPRRPNDSNANTSVAYGYPIAWYSDDIYYPTAPDGSGSHWINAVGGCYAHYRPPSASSNPVLSDVSFDYCSRFYSGTKVPANMDRY
jgi:hypothetical protein